MDLSLQISHCYHYQVTAVAFSNYCRSIALILTTANLLPLAYSVYITLDNCMQVFITAVYEHVSSYLKLGCGHFDHVFL